MGKSFRMLALLITLVLGLSLPKCAGRLDGAGVSLRGGPYHEAATERKMQGHRDELCFVPSGDGIGFSQKDARPCEFPFDYVNSDKSVSAVLTVPNFSSYTPGGLKTLGLSGEEWGEMTWCATDDRYNRWNPSEKRKWGVAECDRPCIIPAFARTGFIKARAQATQCQLPFKFYNRQNGWVTFDYPPTISEAEPFGIRDGSAGLVLPQDENQRWCPEIGVHEYDAREQSNSKASWGTVSCEGHSCRILGLNGFGWIAGHDDDCQLPFAYRRHSQAEWQWFRSPPTLIEAPPYGIDELGLEQREHLMRELRWCPRLGVRTHDPSDSSVGEDRLKAWGTVDCDSPSPTSKPTIQTRSPSTWVTLPPTPLSAKDCSIPEGSVGWIQFATDCQIPFLFTGLDGTTKAFDYPPSFAEAQPYGLAELGLRENDEFTRWCPADLGNDHHYNARDDSLAKLWGVVKCDSKCHIGGPNLALGWIKRASECEFPFSYVAGDGAKEQLFDFPPTIKEAPPFGLTMLGLDPGSNPAHAGLRWCPQMGVKVYGVDRQLDKKWGIAMCDPNMQFPTARPTGPPVMSYCSTDGGYAAYDEPCTFPFTTADGQTHHQCASLEESSPYQGEKIPPNPPIAEIALPLDHARWCALDSVYDGETPAARKRWGYCNARTCGICTTNTGNACLRLDQLPTSGRSPPTGRAFSDHCLVRPDDTLGQPVCVENSDWNQNYGGINGNAWEMAPCDPQACHLPPTQNPTVAPTQMPTSKPSASPTLKPTARPTIKPSENPSTPVPTAEKCTTNGGGYVQAGSPCVLPFVFRKKVYYECEPLNVTEPFWGTNVPPRESPEPQHQVRWCPTVRQYSKTDTNKRKKWGICSSSCPGRPTPSPTSLAPSEQPTSQPSLAPTEDETPQATNARYSDSGALIQVFLDSPLHSSIPTYSNRWFACSRVLEDLAATRLLCRWFINRRGLFVQPTRERVVLIILKQGALRADQFVTSPRQAVAVDPPFGNDGGDHNRLGRALVVAPSLVSPCDDMRHVLLDASQSWNVHLMTEIHFLVRESLGQGGRKEEEDGDGRDSYGRSSRSFGRDATLPAPIVLRDCSFSSLVEAPSYESLFCEFDLVDFLDGIDKDRTVEAVDVAVQVRSIFEDTATSRWRTIHIEKQPSISLRVEESYDDRMGEGGQGEPFQLSLGQPKVFSFTILNAPFGSECKSYAQGTLPPHSEVEWSAKSTEVEIPDLMQVDSDPLSARISSEASSNLLKAGDQILVTVRVSHPDISGPSSFTWYVSVEPPEGAVAHVAGGNRTLWSGQTALLDASLSYVPFLFDKGQGGSSEGTYKWRCWPKHACATFRPYFENGTETNDGRTGAEWSFSDTGDQLQVVSGLPVLVLVPFGSQDNLGGVTMWLELEYFDSRDRVTLEITKVPGQGPMSLPQPYIEMWGQTVSGRSLLQLKGSCSEQSDSIAWALEDPINTGTWLPMHHPNLASLSVSLRATKMHSWLQVDSGSMIALTDQFPGDHFTFRLDCGDASLASSTVSIPSTFLPYNGRTLCTPSSGLAAHTQFEIFTSDWSDDSPEPPKYSFEFVALDASTGSELLSSLTFATSIGKQKSSRLFPVSFPYLRRPGKVVLLDLVAVARDSNEQPSEADRPTHVLLEHAHISSKERNDLVLQVLEWDQRHGQTSQLSTVAELWNIANAIAQIALNFDASRADVADTVTLCGAQVAFFNRLTNWITSAWVPYQDLPVFMLQVAPLVPVALAAFDPETPETCGLASGAALTALHALLDLWDLKYQVSGTNSIVPLWDEQSTSKAIRTLSACLLAALGASSSSPAWIESSVFEEFCSSEIRTDGKLSPFFDLACSSSTSRSPQQGRRRRLDEGTKEGTGLRPKNAATVRSFIAPLLDLQLANFIYTFAPREFSIPGIVQCFSWRRDLETFLQDRHLVLQQARVLFPAPSFRSVKEDPPIVDVQVCSYVANSALRNSISPTMRVISTSLTHISPRLDYSLFVDASNKTNATAAPELIFTFSIAPGLDLDQNKVVQSAVCAKWDPESKSLDSSGCILRSVEPQRLDSPFFAVCSCIQEAPLPSADHFVGLFEPLGSDPAFWRAQLPVALLLTIPLAWFVAFVVWGAKKDRAQAADRAKGLFLIAIRANQLERKAQRRGIASLGYLRKAHLRLERRSVLEAGTKSHAAALLLINSSSTHLRANSLCSKTSSPKGSKSSSIISADSHRSNPCHSVKSGSSSSKTSPGENAGTWSEGPQTTSFAHFSPPQQPRGQNGNLPQCMSAITCAIGSVGADVLKYHLLFSQVRHFDLKMQRPVRALLCMVSSYLLLILSTLIFVNNGANGSSFVLVPLVPLCALPIVLLAKLSLKVWLPPSGGSGILRACRPSLRARAHVRDAWEEKEDLLMLRAKKDDVREAAASLSRLNCLDPPPPPVIHENDVLIEGSSGGNSSDGGALAAAQAPSRPDALSEELVAARARLHTVMHEVTAAESFVLKRHNQRRRAQLTRRLQGVQPNIACQVRRSTYVSPIAMTCVSGFAGKNNSSTLRPHVLVEEILHPRTSTNSTASGTSDHERNPFRSPCLDVRRPHRFSVMWLVPFFLGLAFSIGASVLVVYWCYSSKIDQMQGWLLALFFSCAWLCDNLIVQPLVIVLFLTRRRTSSSTKPSPTLALAKESDTALSRGQDYGHNAHDDDVAPKGAQARPTESDEFVLVRDIRFDSFAAAGDVSRNRSRGSQSCAGDNQVFDSVESKTEQGGLNRDVFHTRRRREQPVNTKQESEEESSQAASAIIESGQPYSGFQEVRLSGSQVSGDTTEWLQGPEAQLIADDAASSAGESTASSYAQVPQRLLEEESETFRAALRRILNEDANSRSASNKRGTGAVFSHPADMASLGELELESDF